MIMYLDSHRKVLLHGQQLPEIHVDVDNGFLSAKRQVACVKKKHIYYFSVEFNDIYVHH